MKKLLKITLSLAVLAYLLWYLIGRWQNLMALFRLTPLELVFLALLAVTGTTVGTLTVQVLMAGLGTPTRFTDMYMLHNATVLLNYLPFKFGSVFRANFLKRRYGFPYTRFAVFFLYLNIFTAMVASAMALIALMTVYGFAANENIIMAVLFGAIVILSIVVCVAPLPHFLIEHRLGRIVMRLLNARADLARRPKILLSTSVLLVLNFLISAARLAIIYHSAGLDIHPAGFLILGALGFACLFLGLTPGGLGIREIVLGFGVSVMGIPFETGLLTAMIDRAILMAWSFSVGLACTAAVVRKYPAALKDSPGAEADSAAPATEESDPMAF